MRIIANYVLEPGCAIRCPEGTEFISCTFYEGDLVLYGIVDPEAPMHERNILIIGTALEAPARLGVFIGTVLVAEGHAIHVFDLGWADETLPPWV